MHGFSQFVKGGPYDFDPLASKKESERPNGN